MVNQTKNVIISSDVQEVLVDHEGRIEKLEKSDIEKEMRLQRVENSYIRLENTIMTENRETREILRDSLKNQMDLIRARDDYKEKQSERDFQYNKTKLERRTEFWMKLLTVGGLVYLLIQNLIELLLK